MRQELSQTRQHPRPTWHRKLCLLRNPSRRLTLQRISVQQRLRRGPKRHTKTSASPATNRPVSSTDFLLRVIRAEMTGSLDHFVLIKASKSRGGVWSDDEYCELATAK